MTKVFIDGSAGTTGLRIADRLANRSDLTILTLTGDARKDPQARKEALFESDIAFLCLPDAAAKEAVALAEGSKVRIIDTSTAHRVNPNWDYGFAELSAAHRSAIENSARVANPGCHASGFINATDLADYLVKKGLPFRSAYKISGSLVALCIKENTVLEELPLDTYKTYSDLFEEDLYTAIDLVTCVETRISVGGPSVADVEAQIQYVKEVIA